MQSPLELVKLLSKVESGEADYSELHDFICLIMKKKVDIQLTEGTFADKSEIRDLTAKPDAEDFAKMKLAMRVSSTQFPVNNRMLSNQSKPAQKK